MDQPTLTGQEMLNEVDDDDRVPGPTLVDMEWSNVRLMNNDMNEWIKRQILLIPDKPHIDRCLERNE